MSEQDRAVAELLTVMTQDTMLLDIATALTCTEADAIARFLSAYNTSPAMFLDAHAEGDDEGDSHFDLRQEGTTQ